MAQTKPKKKSTANKRSTSKSTAKKKTTPKSKSSKPNNGKSRARMYSDTSKTKTRELTRDDFINMDDIRKFKAGASELASGFKRGLKAQAAEHKAKKQAKKDEKNAKYIERYNKKLKLRKDENGVIETDNDTQKTEPSPLDRSERTKKKRFRFF